MSLPGTAPQEHVTYCRICVAGCGLVVVTDGDRVLEVRGDRSHPDSAGYTCPKGRALGAHHHDPNRLNDPVVRGRAVPWDECLDDLAGALGRVIDSRGADAVATYVATGHYC